jgi:hypothetical protein
LEAEVIRARLPAAAEAEATRACLFTLGYVALTENRASINSQQLAQNLRQKENLAFQTIETWN